MGPISVADSRATAGFVRHQYYAQFSRTLGTLMENGIPLLKALDLVTEIAGQQISRGETPRRAAGGDRWRESLQRALAQGELFPELFTDMMAVGEQTGHFAQTMQTIADVYERELDRTVQYHLGADPAGHHRADRDRGRLCCLQHSLGGLRNDAQFAVSAALR